MNDVLQADDYFRQAFALVRDDFQTGRTAVLATADHGEEIRDHGVFGHASATFWNEKIVVPFALGLPGASLAGLRHPALTAHVDVWPTLFDYLGMDPRLDVASYSDGRSLLRPESSREFAYISGRYFPYADRPSVVVDGQRKYWFRVTGVERSNRLCLVVTRVTDLDDHALTVPSSALQHVPALDALQSTFWRFLRFSGPYSAPCSGV
jgi:arylsulfatase A-like enzyme